MATIADARWERRAIVWTITNARREGFAIVGRMGDARWERGAIVGAIADARGEGFAIVGTIVDASGEGFAIVGRVAEGPGDPRRAMLFALHERGWNGGATEIATRRWDARSESPCTRDAGWQAALRETTRGAQRRPRSHPASGMTRHGAG